MGAKMSKHLVYMSWGHIGKLLASPQLGAKHENKLEVLYIPHYIQAMTGVFLKKGIHCMVDGVGPYSRRHLQAIEYSPRFTRVAYLSCHLNYFPVDKRQRPLFLYDYRSSGGRRLAASVVNAVAETWSEPRPPISMACHPGDWTRNAFGCVDGVYAGPSNISAICCEPLAMNGTPNLTIATVKNIGRRMAHGVVSWLEE